VPTINKFLIGAITTALLAVIFHGGFRFGERFIDRLDRDTVRAIAQTPNAIGITAKIDRSGPFYRIATLSGPILNPAERDRIRTEVLAASPGLFDARWEGDAAAAPPSVQADTGEAATAGAVQDCQAQLNKAFESQTIEFVNGSAAIESTSEPLLNMVAGLLGPCQNMRVAIIGHTDSAGGTARNLRLSEERANMVVEALIARGIPASRLQPQGMGEAKPLDRGQSAEAMARNRRIEFTVSAKPSGQI
jgi:outer membrane protein OmpA-like peptidoglycan-associated protein